MKITIDTKEDSHQDIKKVIRLLEHLLGDEVHSNYESAPKNIFEDNSTPGIGGGLFGMFGDTSAPSPSEPYSKPTPEAPSMSTIFSDEEVQDEKAKVRFYGV